MASIANIRKFLVRERFVIAKGDYLGHPFRGNQYDQLSTGEHYDMARSAVRDVANLRSAGRSRRWGARPHGTALDGEIAEAAMNAIDHLVTAREKLQPQRDELNGLMNEWKKTGETKTPSDYCRNVYSQGNDPKMDLAQKIARLQDYIGKIDRNQSPSGLSRRSWNHTINIPELSKVAVSALNRGYKEISSSGKSLIDKNNQPRPATLANALDLIKSNTDKANQTLKIINNDKADPLERAASVALLDTLIKRASGDNNFIAQVYRLAGDKQNADKYADVRKSITDAGRQVNDALKSQIYTNAGNVLVAQGHEIFDKYKDLLTLPEKATPSDIQELMRASGLLSQANENYTKAGNFVGYADASFAKLRQIKNENSTSLLMVNSIIDTSKSADLKSKMDDALNKVGSSTMKLVHNPAYGSNQPELYVSIKSADTKYRETTSALTDAAKRWNNLAQAAETATPSSYDKQELINLANKNKQQVADQMLAIRKEAQDKLGVGYLQVGQSLLKNIQDNIGSNDPAVAKQSEQNLTLAESCSRSARDFLTSTYDKPIEGKEAEFAQAKELAKSVSHFSNIVSGSEKAASGIALYNTRGPVSAEGVVSGDYDSYYEKYNRIANSLMNANGLLNNVLDNKDTFTEAEKAKVEPFVKAKLDEVKEALGNITKEYKDEMPASAIKLGRESMAIAKDPNADSPRAAWSNAYKYLDFASNLLSSHIISANTQQEKDALTAQRTSVDADRAIASQESKKFDRENRYLL